MVKKDWIKKTENGDVVTRFWYTLKNLDPIKLGSQYLHLELLISTLEI
jgi:hypothetical protein